MSDEIQLALQVFVSQSCDGLVEMEEAALALEAEPENSDCVNTIFRICHTIKGDAVTVGFGGISAFAHELENLLNGARSGEVQVDSGLVTLLLQCADVLRNLIQEAVENGDERRTAPQELIEKIREWDTVRPDKASGSPRESQEVSGGTPQRAPENVSTGSDEHRRSVRVGVATLDRLLDLTGELAIGRSQIEQLLGSTEVTLDAIREAHESMDPLFAGLQDEVMKVRMVPIGPVFRSHVRTVRDLALTEGKRAFLDIEGADVELDLTVVEHVRQCLGHVVRNSITHGIEAPDERERQGKDPRGRVVLRAFHEGGSFVVEIEDDGAGLDPDRILSRARALDLIGDVEALSETDAARLVFEPGFSTQEQVSMGAGRGVGMDAVRESIEALGGSVSLSSRRGKGSTVTLRLPLTLAIIEGFIVGVSGERYVLPLAHVIECIDFKRFEELGSTSSGVVNLRDNAVPCIRLCHLLGREPSEHGREAIVVIRHGSKEAGIVVDELYGKSQVVIKPLGNVFRDLPCIAGSTILGTGDVALILDVSILLRTSIGWLQGGESQGGQLNPGSLAKRSTEPFGEGDERHA